MNLDRKLVYCKEFLKQKIPNFNKLKKIVNRCWKNPDFFKDTYHIQKTKSTISIGFEDDETIFYDDKLKQYHWDYQNFLITQGDGFLQLIFDIEEKKDRTTYKIEFSNDKIETEKIHLYNKQTLLLKYFSNNDLKKVYYIDNYILSFENGSISIKDENGIGISYQNGGIFDYQSTRITEKRQLKNILSISTIQKLISESLWKKSAQFIYDNSKIFIDEKQSLLLLINDFRNKLGLSKLKYNHKLESNCKLHSQYIKANQKAINAMYNFIKSFSIYKLSLKKFLLLENNNLKSYFERTTSKRCQKLKYHHPVSEFYIFQNNIISVFMDIISNPFSREIIIDPFADEFGCTYFQLLLFSENVLKKKNICMITIGKHSIKTQNNHILVYPYNNQTSIPVSSFINGEIKGYPITISVRGKDTKIKELFIEDENKNRLLNINSSNCSKDIVHFISDKPLKYDHLYSINACLEDENGDKTLFKSVFKTEKKNTILDYSK